MAAKRFHVEKPEELLALAEYAKETPNCLGRMARIWAADRQKKGRSRWDKAIYAIFSGDRRRKAEIIRFSASDTVEVCADIRYNLGLAWSENHLRLVDD